VKVRNHLVQAAVAAVLAGSASMSADAASYWIHISGASAQRTLWEGDMEAIATGTFGSTKDSGGNTVCTLTKTTPALKVTGQSYGVPDLHTLVCTISSVSHGTITSPVAVGDVVTLYYEAEYGSVWGIAPFVPGSVASTRGRSPLDPASGGAVVGYSRDKDTATSGLLAPLPVDIGVSDNEPLLWASQDNWAYSDGLSNSAPDGTGTNGVINVLGIPGVGQPSLSQLETLEQKWTFVNGEVFSFVVDNSASPTNLLTNLSTQSLRSIFTGQYTTWNQVPEVAGAGYTGTANIVVCRRDHGSGTEVTLSKFLTQNECGGNNGISDLGSAAGGAPRIVSLNTNPAGSNENALNTTAGTIDGISENPIENYSSNDIKSCLSSNPGISIGVLVLGTGSAYTTLKVDGVEANAHNGALGLYPFIAEDWAFNNTATSQATTPNGAQAIALAKQLFTDVTKNTGVLPTENGSFVGGSWVAAGTTSGQLTNFYLEDSLNGKPTVSSTTEIGNPSIPTAVWTNSTNRSACTILTNDNK
jgi:ABC-type phosphate transport system substrate-binding protein